MKITIHIILALFLVSTINAQEEVKTFALKSGYIEYKLSEGITGTRKMWWDNYGDKTRTETNSKTVIKILGMESTEETHTIVVMIKDKMWTADLKKNTGYKGTVPFYEERDDFVESMTEQELEEFSKELLESLGGEIIGTESIKGYKCDIIEVMGSKIWVYNGLPLKSEIKVMGNSMNEIITEFSPNISVPKSTFEPYTGVEYQEMSNSQQNLYDGMF